MTARATPRRLRVAAITATRILSGPGRQLTAVASDLSSHGVDLHVVLLHRRGQERSPLLDHLDRHSVGWTQIEEARPFDPGLVRRTDRFLRSWGPDIVQTHGYKPTVLAAAMTRILRRGWPWIGFFHGTTTENTKVGLYHALDLSLLRLAHRVVVMSRQQADLIDVAADRLSVIWNAVLPEFEDRHGGDRRGQEAGPARIGVVGRLSPEKGVDVFLRALAKVSASGKLVEARIAGDGPEATELQRLTAELGLGASVEFVGRVHEMGPFYRELDLLVIPSRSEGLPNVLLEALAADVPVVSTSVGAVPDVIGDSAAAILVDSEDAGALAEAIVRALKTGMDPGVVAARRDRARAFSLEARTAAHLSLYSRLVGAPALGGPGPSSSNTTPLGAT